MTSAAPPSGKQFSLQLGAGTAVVTEVGAGLRSYCVDGRELLDGYGIDQMCTGARGQTFIPWPNRIADGRYDFDGVAHQLPLTEPEAHNAIHGLTRWSEWHLTGGNGHSLTLQTILHASPGFPFPLRCRIRYRLHSGGLSVETRATNIGTSPCPYATGAHPYVSLGTSRIDELTVGVPARRYLPTDERGIPTGSRSVEGTRFDLREPTPLGDRAIDNAFTDLIRDGDGGCEVTVRSPAGRALRIWLGPAYRYVEVFTGDTLPDPCRRRRGLGVEPMTAAPNAFRTGEGLTTLHPGQTHTATWELRPGAR